MVQTYVWNAQPTFPIVLSAAVMDSVISAMLDFIQLMDSNVLVVQFHYQCVKSASLAQCVINV
jgi:hypothetical protein